jgi:4-amino-4-deoxy-L-arabinose transferase-like glycosyltransferase
VVLVAAAIRFHGLDWDAGIGAHPDERYLVETASRMSLPDKLNPFDAAPHLAYGHLPVSMLALASGLAPKVDPLLVGRILAASFDLGTVVVTFALGRRLYNELVGLLASASVSLMVAHVQQAHFYTADTPLVFFTSAALLFAVRHAQDGHPLDAGLAGGAAGLALATKAAAGLLLVPLLTACWGARVRRRPSLIRCGLAAGAAFVLSSPFALLEPGTLLSNLARQAAVLRGAVEVPYTRQYRGTWPFIYPIRQQLQWGMGWTMGTAAILGVAHQVVEAVRRPPTRATWVSLSWVVVGFSFVGALYAKFPRYLLPILPVAAIYAAQLVTAVANERRLLLVSLCGLLLGSLIFRATALSTMYRAQHPWVAASTWLRGHAQPGSTVAVEAWDHPLPVDSADYVLIELPIFREETSEKWTAMDDALHRADYLVVASRRGYASLARWPRRYERTMVYYRRLFEGARGFEPVACFERHPRVGPIAFGDDPTAGLDFALPGVCGPGVGIDLGRLDESFVVYDHPTVVVFKAVR